MQSDYQILSHSNQKIKIRIHNTYEISQQSQLGKNVKQWLNLLNKKQKQKTKKSNIFKISQSTYFPTFEFLLLQQKPQNSKCCICQQQYQSLNTNQMQQQLKSHNQSDIIALKCSHKIHFSCLKSLIGNKDWLKCPVCLTIYGKMVGDQPDGKMSYKIQKSTHCDGYNNCGTIFITYSMHGGKRGAISYPGTTRGALLPDNKQGHQILKLLQQAFNRKLIFTVGRSVTTGLDNQIVWNGIHHKTSLQGGSANFGFPDPTYFKRVKLELADKGVY